MSLVTWLIKIIDLDNFLYFMFIYLYIYIYIFIFIFSFVISSPMAYAPARVEWMSEWLFVAWPLTEASCLLGLLGTNVFIGLVTIVYHILIGGFCTSSWCRLRG